VLVVSQHEAVKRLRRARLIHQATHFYNANSHQHQIEATDSQIDALVYELYGLTEEKIWIVEIDVTWQFSVVHGLYRSSNE
jgi:adenylosuccinate lyase